MTKVEAIQLAREAFRMQQKSETALLLSEENVPKGYFSGAR